MLDKKKREGEGLYLDSLSEGIRPSWWGWRGGEWFDGIGNMRWFVSFYCIVVDLETERG